MTAAVVVSFVVLVVVLAIVIRRRRVAVPALAPPPPVADWLPIGSEFASLSEAERCDLVFAVAALDDVSCETLLGRALRDPSEAVALAAARALTRRGGPEMLEGYLTSCPSERARSLRLLVEILN